MNHEMQTHKSAWISPRLYRFLHCRPVFLSAARLQNELEELFGHKVISYRNNYSVKDEGTILEIEKQAGGCIHEKG